MICSRCLTVYWRSVRLTKSDILRIFKWPDRVLIRKLAQRLPAGPNQYCARTALTAQRVVSHNQSGLSVGNFYSPGES